MIQINLIKAHAIANEKIKAYKTEKLKENTEKYISADADDDSAAKKIAKDERKILNAIDDNLSGRTVEELKAILAGYGITK